MSELFKSKSYSRQHNTRAKYAGILFLTFCCPMFIAQAAQAWVYPSVPNSIYGLNQGHTGSCYSFAVAAAIEDYYARWKETKGIAIAPLHLFYYLNKDASTSTREDRSLPKVYTAETIRILEREGPLVPLYEVPETFEGTDREGVDGIALPDLEMLGVYSNRPDNYGYSRRQAEEIYARSSEDYANQISRLVQYNIVTMAISGDYLQTFNAVYGLRDDYRMGANDARFSELSHEVAVVGVIKEGIVVRNSWNSTEAVYDAMNTWENDPENSDRWFKRKLFPNERYVHGIFLIPFGDFHFSNFKLTIHKFDTRRFAENFRRGENSLSTAKAYYYCGNPAKDRELMLALHAIKDKPGTYAPNFSELLDTHVLNPDSNFHYATLPYRLGVFREEIDFFYREYISRFYCRDRD